MTHRYKNGIQDKQAAMTGKSENDTNKLGRAEATQKNEGRRTPNSRHDRDNLIGNNQTHMRQGGPNREKRAVRVRAGSAAAEARPSRAGPGLPGPRKRSTGPGQAGSPAGASGRPAA